MAKKTKKETIQFTCACHLNIDLHKTFEVEEGTPPEQVNIQCPNCPKKMRIEIGNQLIRDIVYRSFEV